VLIGAALVGVRVKMVCAATLEFEVAQAAGAASAATSRVTPSTV
jgi:hypothetical protein